MAERQPERSWTEEAARLEAMEERKANRYNEAPNGFWQKHWQKVFGVALLGGSIFTIEGFRINLFGDPQTDAIRGLQDEVRSLHTMVESQSRKSTIESSSSENQRDSTPRTNVTPSPPVSRKNTTELPRTHAIRSDKTEPLTISPYYDEQARLRRAYLDQQKAEKAREPEFAKNVSGVWIAARGFDQVSMAKTLESEVQRRATILRNRFPAVQGTDTEIAGMLHGNGIAVRLPDGQRFVATGNESSMNTLSSVYRALKDLCGY